MHNRLFKIKSISGDKKSFILRQGRFDGIVEGSIFVFKAKELSFSAIAKKVSRYYSHWQVLNPGLQIPVSSDEFVVAYKGKDYLWTHHDGNMITKRHKEALRPTTKWVEINFFYLKGLTESTSNVLETVEVSRNGLGFKGSYFREISVPFYWSLSFLFERESIDIRAGELKTDLMAFNLGLHYISQPISIFYDGRFRLGVLLGAGITNTVSSASSQSGQSLILPALQGGFMFQVSPKLSWSLDLGFESRSTQERVQREKQSTDQLNFKILFGFQYYFSGF